MKQIISVMVLMVVYVANALAGATPVVGGDTNTAPPIVGGGSVSVDEPSMLPLLAVAAVAVFIAKKFRK